MSAHPKLTALGDQLESAKQAAITVAFWLIAVPVAAVSAAVLGSITFLALLNLLGRFL